MNNKLLMLMLAAAMATCPSNVDGATDTVKSATDDLELIVETVKPNSAVKKENKKVAVAPGHIKNCDKGLYEKLLPYADTIAHIAKITNQDPTTYAAIIYAESKFNPRAVGNGITGIGQMTRVAKKEVNVQVSGTYSALSSLEKMDKSKFSESQMKNYERLKRNSDIYSDLVGSKIDSVRYSKDPNYQISVSMAYFYVLYDQMRSAAEKRVVKIDLVEAAICGYNMGGPSAERLIRVYGESWKNHKNSNARNHWKKVSRYRDMIQVVVNAHDELKNKFSYGNLANKLQTAKSDTFELEFTETQCTQKAKK